MRRYAIRRTHDNSGFVFALILCAVAYGLFAVVFQIAVIPRYRSYARSDASFVIRGWPAVWQGITMLALSAILFAYQLSPEVWKRLKIKRIVLLGIIVFLSLQVATYVSLRHDAEKARRARRERIEQHMNDPATTQQHEELSRKWVEDIRRRARSSKASTPQESK